MTAKSYPLGSSLRRSTMSRSLGIVKHEEVLQRFPWLPGSLRISALHP